MSKHIYDKYDVDIVKLWEKGLNKTEICKTLDISFDQLRLRAKELKLEFEKPLDLTPHLKDILEMRGQKISIRKIAKKYENNHVAISTFLKKHDQSTEMFRHKFNHNFFDNIDNEANAYFLGMMLSDGFVQEGRTGLNLTDRDVIEKFKKAIEYDGEIRVLDGAKPHHKKHYEINLYSVYMQKVLEKYNIVQNKSLILEFPNKELIPNNMIRHVIRGIFDGDGGFKYYEKRKSWNIVITGTKDICEKIKEYSKIDSEIYYASQKENSNTWQWVVRKRLEIIKFVEWIYGNTTIYMDRKFKQREECINYLKTRKPLDCSYIKPGKSFKKSNIGEPPEITEHSFMKKAGYVRVWDCGKKKNCY